MSKRERFSPERLALLLLMALAGLVLVVGIVAPAGLWMEKLELLPTPDPGAGWSIPPAVPPPGTPPLRALASIPVAEGPAATDVAFGSGDDLYVLRPGGVVERRSISTGSVEAKGRCEGYALQLDWAEATDLVRVLSPTTIEFLDGRSLQKTREDIQANGPGGFGDRQTFTRDGRWLVAMRNRTFVAWNLEVPERPPVEFGRSGYWNDSSVYLGNDRMLFSWPVVQKGNSSPGDPQEFEDSMSVGGDPMFDESMMFAGMGPSPAGCEDVVVDLRTGEALSTWTRPGASPPNLMCLNTDGKHVLKFTWSVVERLDVETGEVVSVGTYLHAGENVAISEVNGLLCDPGGILRGLIDNAVVGFVPWRGADPFGTFEFSPDGQQLLRTSHTGEITVFDVTRILQGSEGTPEEAPRTDEPSPDTEFEEPSTDSP